VRVPLQSQAHGDRHTGSCGVYVTREGAGNEDIPSAPRGARRLGVPNPSRPGQPAARRAASLMLRRRQCWRALSAPNPRSEWEFRHDRASPSAAQRSPAEMGAAPEPNEAVVSGPCHEQRKGEDSETGGEERTRASQLLSSLCSGDSKMRTGCRTHLSPQVLTSARDCCAPPVQDGFGRQVAARHNGLTASMSSTTRFSAACLVPVWCLFPALRRTILSARL